MSIKERIGKLISVKSLLTLVLTAVFAYLSVKQVISGSEFMTIFTTVIAFYFGTQSNKKENE